METVRLTSLGVKKSHLYFVTEGYLARVCR